MEDRSSVVSDTTLGISNDAFPIPIVFQSSDSISKPSLGQPIILVTQLNLCKDIFLLSE